jgi:hypothetical protein
LAALYSDTTGNRNTGLGVNVLRANTIGVSNTAIGTNALYSNSASNNTATGDSALFSNTTATGNTADGAFALFRNNIGYNNTASGASSLHSNTSGFDNTADGVNALISNDNGNYNTATGVNAMYGNTSGGYNTANGVNALASNNGYFNTATGVNALELNTSGSYNTAVGYQALPSNNAGANNTAIGAQTLFSNNNASNNNTAIGITALYSNTSGNANTATGVQALYNNMTGNFNTAIGFNAGLNTTGSYNVNIGNQGVAGESRTVRIGTGDGTHTRMFLAATRGVTTGQANAIPVLIDGAGQLGTASSSRRFKDNIQPMKATSEAILALKPVSFRYKSDKTNTPQFGLIAEEVAEVNPDLVVRDNKGEIYTVRYDAVNAMLLNEFLKEHKRVEQQSREIREAKDTIGDLKKGMDTVAAELKEQESRIQRVSAQLELSKGATRTVADKE